MPRGRKKKVKEEKLKEKKSIEQYAHKGKERANNPQKVVLEALVTNGVNVHPGERIQYIIRDSQAENPPHRYVSLKFIG